MPLPCSPTPAGSTCLAMTTRRRGPRADHDEGSRDEVTFEAQSHSFSTGCLRFAGWVTPPTTQDSLPVAGSALPDGLEYPQGSDERFQTHVMFVILLSHAFVAQGQACILHFRAGTPRTTPAIGRSPWPIRKSRRKGRTAKRFMMPTVTSSVRSMRKANRPVRRSTRGIGV